MKVRTYRFLVVVLIVLTFMATHWLAQASAGNSYYVATTGNDTNPGTEAKPFRTIQKAANLARAGDSIYVRGGVYKNVLLRYSGAPGQPITLKNYPGEKPIIESSSGVQGVTLSAVDGYQKPIGWIIVDGFEIRNSDVDGIKFNNAHDIIIRNNNIHDNFDQGIMGVGGYRVTIDRNIIHHNGLAPPPPYNQQHGIYASGTYYTITNNLIYSNKAHGIQVAGYEMGSDYASVEYSGARHWLISNNTIAFEKYRPGITVWQSDATDDIIQNNIFYKNSDSTVSGIYFTGSGTGHIVRNNLFYSPLTSILDSAGGASYTASNNIEKDPLMVNPASFDFHLTSASPAINAGTSQSSPPFDFDGVIRLQGSAPHIGAYQSTSVDTTTQGGLPPPKNLRLF